MTGQDLDGAIAMRVNAIVGEARFQALAWQRKGKYYAPPLFRMPGVELPIVPRVALPRVDRSGGLGKPFR